MRPQEFLSAAIAAAPPTEAGTAELRSRVPPATAALQAARRSVKAVNGEIDTLARTQAALKARSDALTLELPALRPQCAAAAVAAVGDPKGRSTAKKVCEQRAGLMDEQSLLSEALAYLEAQAAELTVRQVTAQIEEMARSRDWVWAAGLADIHELHRAFLAALQADPAASFNLGEGSKVNAYAAKLNRLDLDLVDLRKELRRFEEIAARVEQHQKESN